MIAPQSKKFKIISNREIVKKFFQTIFQYNGNIPVTGVLDDKTKELLKTPRCGVPDNFYGRRRKRFTQTGSWPKTDLTWK